MEDVSDTPLHRALRLWSSETLNGMARRIRHAMQRTPATGIFGDASHRSLWHEVRHEVREGPTPGLERAFHQLFLDAMRGQLFRETSATLTLLSVGATWFNDGDEAELASQPAIDETAIGDAVRNILHELAGEDNFGR